MININLSKNPGDLQGDIVPTTKSPVGIGGQNSIILKPGNSWYSPGGAFRLTLQLSDRNLLLQTIVLASPQWETGQPLDANDPKVVGWVPVWSSRTGQQGTTEVDMQIDGNLVGYAGRSSLVTFNAKKSGNENSFLRVQDDGNLVIYSSSGVAIFATNTSVLESTGHNT